MKSNSVRMLCALGILGSVFTGLVSGCGQSDPTMSNPEQDEQTIDNLALAYLANEVPLGKYGISLDDVRVRQVDIDDLQHAHARIFQTFQGVPVFGGEAIVHLDEHGQVFAFTNDFVRNLELTASTKPSVIAADAVRAARTYAECAFCNVDEPGAELIILRHENRDRLAYRVPLRRANEIAKNALPIIFIDAHTGELIWQYDNLQTGTGPSLYSGNVSFDTRTWNGTYYLEDLQRRVTVFDYRNFSTTTAYRYSDINDVWSAPAQAPGVDVMYGMEKFLDYMSTAHNRNGLNGTGGPLTSTSIDGTTSLMTGRARVGINWNNATWDGTRVSFGDGDGTRFGPLVTLDIVGHEMMHAVTQFTAGLIYVNESGALNESWSDVFGALLEHYVKGFTNGTWQIGEQCYTPATPGDALRFMNEPHAASNAGYTADDDPDHYSERYTGGADNGGVHINSGIPNKVFYLVANGGTHHIGGTVNGIGINAAARIWYRALTSYMTSSTNFAGAREATLNAASALYGTGSAERQAVLNAWAACGIN